MPFKLTFQHAMGLEQHGLVFGIQCVMKKLIVLCIAFFAITFCTNAFAERMMFIHSGTGSGTIGGVDFTDASFTIKGIGDTDNRYSFTRADSPDKGYWINHDSTSIFIENVGRFQFITGTRTFVNNSLKVAGLSRSKLPGEDGLDLYNGPKNQLLANWNMLTSIGPIPGNDFRLMQWDRSPQITTDCGILLFNSQGNFAGSFEATTVIPEPSTLALLSIGIVCLLAYRRRDNETVPGPNGTLDDIRAERV